MTLGATAQLAVLVLDSQLCGGGGDVTLSAPATKIEGDVGICAGVSADSSLSDACGTANNTGDCRDASTTAATLTFNSTTGADVFIINVTGPGVAGVHTLNNVKTVLNFPATVLHPAAQILWNFTSPGTTVSFYKPDATLAGSVLVPDGSFIMDHGRLDGEHSL